MEEIIFPNQIRMIRRTRGKTMKEIAALLNVSLSAISKIEKGYRRIDEEQLKKISSFLNCPKESIFVFETTSQQEVLNAWQREQDRRKQINEKSGLKTLGAGLRYLRGEKMLTLLDVAKGAGLTLSVYHRIEMGQREVTEEQFKKIAHALGFTPENLQVKIYELDMAGSLQEFKKTGKPGIFHPKGGYNDLPLKEGAFSMVRKVPVLEKDGTSIQVELPLDESLCAVELSQTDFKVPLFSKGYVLLATKDKPEIGDVVAVRKDALYSLGRLSEQGIDKGREVLSVPSDESSCFKVIGIYVG